LDPFSTKRLATRSPSATWSTTSKARSSNSARYRAVERSTPSRWRALYLEFLAHAARDAAFRRRFSKRTDEMRGALDEVVVQRTEPFVDALGMEPEQLAVVIEALGIGLWAHHMVHGSRAVPRDLFSKALTLLVDGIAARAAATPVTEGATR
jgi:BetI-type transcriptional repressor, C-terminal